jgi:filamentous hemagglutinin
VQSRPPGQSVRIDDKIAAQLAARGWTEREIRNAIDRPAIGTSIDNTGGRNDPASVYGSKSGGYVVLNDVTKRVVQVSDRTDPSWLPDSRISWSEK